MGQDLLHSLYEHWSSETDYAHYQLAFFEKNILLTIF